MEETRALTIIDATDVSLVEESPTYGDDLQQSGHVASLFARLQVFEDYHKECTENTRRRQRNDLELFTQYLASVRVSRRADDLYSDADAWHGMNYGHLKAFRQWLLNQGYSIGSVNVSLATIRKYCALAFEVGVIDAVMHDLIKTVKGYSHKNGRNIDTERTKQGKETRVGKKKAIATRVSLRAARKLENTTITPERVSSRAHDKLLEPRDTLMICLLMEHMLRCSEVALLKIESFDFDQNEITVYRKKTDDTGTYELLEATKEAAHLYIDLVGRKTGPLFTGYDVSKPISTQAINKRVGELGKLAGIEKLSPHDLRHYGTINAIKSGSSLDLIQAYGGWKSHAMVMHYAKEAGVTHKGLKITK